MVRHRSLSLRRIDAPAVACTAAGWLWAPGQGPGSRWRFAALAMVVGAVGCGALRPFGGEAPLAAAEPPPLRMQSIKPITLSDPRASDPRAAAPRAAERPAAASAVNPSRLARLSSDRPLPPPDVVDPPETLSGGSDRLEASLSTDEASRRPLSEVAIADLAYQRAWTATVLERQANQLAAEEARRHRGAAPSSSLTQTFLRGQAARQRGEAIAEALQGHYALRMLLEQATLIDSSLETATGLQEQIERAIELGLVPATDDSVWQVQSTLAELRDRRAQVTGRIAEIRQQMAARLQAPWLCDYVPADSLQAALPPGDCAQWCRDALAQRADYQSWQRILSRMDETSLPEVQRLVSQLIPAWTAGAPLPASWLHHLPIRLSSRRSVDVAQLRSQMARALQGFGNQICADVQTTAIQLETALQRADLAADRIEPIEEQLARVRQLAEIGQDNAAEEARWVLRRQQAQLERLSRQGEAKQAELEMRRHMGFWDS